MGIVDLLRRTLHYFRQNPWLSVLGIATVAVSLGLIAMFALLVVNARSAVTHWSSDMQVVIYLDPPPGQALASQWQTALRSIAEIDEVRYIDTTEAMRRFKARLGADADLLDGVGDGVLPASLEISLRPDFRNQQAVAALVERLRQNNDWRDIHYARDWVVRYDAVVRLLRTIGMALGAFLVFSSLFVIANTIRLMVLARGEEIEVMRLVGATPLYVNLPFLAEGAFQGAVGGLAAVGLGYGLYIAVGRQGLVVLLQAIGVEHVSFLPLAWQAGLVLIGAGIGFIGSLAAVLRLRKE